VFRIKPFVERCLAYEADAVGTLEGRELWPACDDPSPLFLSFTWPKRAAQPMVPTAHRPRKRGSAPRVATPRTMFRVRTGITAIRTRAAETWENRCLVFFSPL